MDLENFLNVLQNAKKFAENSFERRLIIILGNNLIEKIVADGLNHFLTESSLVVSDDRRIPNLLSAEVFFVGHRDTKRILGKTFDNALIDLRWYPDVISMSRAVETVRGGGLIFLMLPLNYKNSRKYLEELVPLGEKRAPRDVLRRRLLKFALKMPGIYVYSSYSFSFIKVPDNEKSCTELHRNRIHNNVSIPASHIFDEALYQLCATQDQVDALREFEKYETMDAYLITADRGRGKSALIGIALTGIALEFFKREKRALRVNITAPEKENTDEIFRFLSIAHEKLSMQYHLGNGRFSSKFIVAEYLTPYDIIRASSDLIVVDEAAGIQFPLLRKIVEKKEKIIFSTTIHGYEGAGRTFSVRFLPLLEKTRKNIKWLTLETPIRYAVNDPVEKWLFKTLLLDAEPAEVSENDLKEIDKARLQELDPFLLFLDETYERLLNEFFGILVTAHYRNNPKDALLLADAPHHRAYALIVNDKVLVAIQVCEEGGLKEDEISLLYTTAPSSHIVPDKIFKYYGEIEFPTLKGWRIVRIATHPKLFRRGLGSLALKKMEDEGARKGVKWIAAGFGCYPELLSFWLKNNYLPVHLSPVVNKTTGEHTIIVAKALALTSQEVFESVNKELKKRLLEELASIFRRLDPESARLVLKSSVQLDSLETLSNSQLFRLNLYMRDVLHFESASDAIRILVRIYFGKNLDFLEPNEEIILIKGILQNSRLTIREILKMRSIVKKVWKHLFQ